MEDWTLEEITQTIDAMLQFHDFRGLATLASPVIVHTLVEKRAFHHLHVLIQHSMICRDLTLLAFNTNDQELALNLKPYYRSTISDQVDTWLQEVYSSRP